MTGSGVDTTDLRVLAIVPAYNEEDSIEEVVRALKQFVPGCDVLVINDGSTDATASRVPACAHVIHLPFNLGIGGAMQAGYRYAFAEGYDIAVQVDGDGQHPPDQIPRLLEPLANGADLVIGSRFLERGQYRQGATRAIGASVLGLVLRILTGKRITDCTSGFRAANREVLCAFAGWYPDDYPEPEVVLLLHRAGFRIVETQVAMNPRETGETSIALHQGLFYVIKVTVALFLDMVRKPWPHEKGARNMTLSLILLAVGASILYLSLRSLRAQRLKERYVVVFVMVGMPFLVLAVWPDAIGRLSTAMGIHYTTVLLLCSTTFFLLTTLKLLSITSVHERQITTLAQMIGILNAKKSGQGQGQGSRDTA